MDRVTCDGSNDDCVGSTEKLGKCGNCHFKKMLPSQQIRIVLFRECRFKERQLLFDSLSALNESKNTKSSEKDDSCGKTSKNGPLSRRNSEEFNHLTDLIFGSTALKYHETYYKIHNISSPQRIIFTQVFIPQRRGSIKKRSNQYFSKNSFTSPTSSYARSDNFTSYDSFSIFRRDSMPTTNPSTSATTMDSGFSELSLASTSSSQLFGSSSKRSFNEHSGVSLDEEYSTRRYSGFSKFGLALIVAVGTENETYHDNYMQNITFVESILNRLRQYVEIALNTPRYFFSVLIDISKDSALWLLDFTHFWAKEGDREQRNKASVANSSWSILNFPKSLFLKKQTSDEFGVFCRVIEEFDVKETNFFLSSLLTSVLMHHTGWVATAYAENTHIELNNSYHAVWMQLTNQQGAVGYLTKTSRTVVYGLKSENVINRLLSFLRYFIRYYKVQRRYVERENIDKENKLVNDICDRNKNIKKNCYNVQEKVSLKKSKTFKMDLSQMVSTEEGPKLEAENEVAESSVVFILGENEKLTNLKKSTASTKPLEKVAESAEKSDNFKVIKFPLPREKFDGDPLDIMPFELSKKDSSLETFVPELIIQGTKIPDKKWKAILKADLNNNNNENVDESVAILANTDEWKLQIWSSKRRKTDQSDFFESSPMVENMLEVILQMGKLNLSKQYCETFIEQRLLEICLKASALAQFLLNTDFCTIDFIVSTLNINTQDVPLLISVGSSLYPELAQKYGLSYQ